MMHLGSAIGDMTRYANFQFDAPAPPPPYKPAIDWMSMLLVGAVAWIAWKQGWIHNGMGGAGLSPKLKFDSATGGGIA